MALLYVVLVYLYWSISEALWYYVTFSPAYEDVYSILEELHWARTTLSMGPQVWICRPAEMGEES